MGREGIGWDGIREGSWLLEPDKASVCSHEKHLTCDLRNIPLDVDAHHCCDCVESLISTYFEFALEWKWNACMECRNSPMVPLCSVCLVIKNHVRLLFENSFPLSLNPNPIPHPFSLSLLLCLSLIIGVQLEMAFRSNRCCYWRCSLVSCHCC